MSVSPTRARVGGDFARVYHAGHGVAEHDLLVINAVAAEKHDPVLRQHEFKFGQRLQNPSGVRDGNPES
jgi:hypothetical protein